MDPRVKTCSVYKCVTYEFTLGRWAYEYTVSIIFEEKTIYSRRCLYTSTYVMQRVLCVIIVNYMFLLFSLLLKKKIIKEYFLEKNDSVCNTRFSRVGRVCLPTG